MKKIFNIYATATLALFFFSNHGQDRARDNVWVQQQLFTRLCFEGKWHQIERLLENGFVPNPELVRNAIKGRAKIDLWRKWWLYSCSTYAGFLLSHMIDDDLIHTHTSPVIRLQCQCLLAGTCGLCSLVIAELMREDALHNARTMLRQSIDWTEQQPRLITSQPRMNPLCIYNQSREICTIGEHDIIDTGSFDPDSGMYIPNFMSAHSFTDCYKQKTASSSGFTFELPGKKVSSIDAYLFGSNNPFTREQRRFVDIEKINLCDKITLEPLTVSYEESLKLSQRFNVTLSQEEIDMCRQSTQSNNVELPLLAHYIKKKL